MTPAKKDVASTPEPTRGLFTSEFLLAISILLISGLMVIVSQNLSAQEWLDFAKWVVGGYSVSRGLAKVTL